MKLPQFSGGKISRDFAYQNNILPCQGMCICTVRPSEPHSQPLLCNQRHYFTTQVLLIRKKLHLISQTKHYLSQTWSKRKQFSLTRPQRHCPSSPKPSNAREWSTALVPLEQTPRLELLSRAVLLIELYVFSPCFPGFNFDQLIANPLLPIPRLTTNKGTMPCQSLRSPQSSRV